MCCGPGIGRDDENAYHANMSLEVSKAGFATMTVALRAIGREARDSAHGEHEGFAVLDRALELGVTHWDTANSYNAGSGDSERLLGKHFRARDSRARDAVVLATKIRNSVREEHEMHRPFSPNEMGSSRKYIMQATEACLRRLGTDYIGILYHHFPNTDPDGSWETPVAETWGAFEDLVRQGKARYLAGRVDGSRRLAD